MKTPLLPLACLGLALAACAYVPPVPTADRDAQAAATATATTGLDAELTTFQYPFPVQSLPIQEQGHSLKLAYMDVAAPNPNGSTVLLLHGKNFSGNYWERTIRTLTGQGYRVVVPDQIGFGKSSKPTNLQYSFQALATHTRALLDALKVERALVVGHSMGGMLATRFALMFPERSAGLVLVNPIGLEDWKRVVPYRTVDQHYQQELKATPESIRAYMRDAYFAAQWKPEYDPLTEILAGWATGPDREQIAKVAALTSDMVFTQPVVHEFPDVKVPTLLIIGMRDKTAIGKGWAPEAVKPTLGDYTQLGKQAAAAIPGAQLLELPGVGHVPQLEAWEEYSAALLKFAQDHR